MTANEQTLTEIALSFNIEGNVCKCLPFGKGLVNRTYSVTCDSGKRYILQRISPFFKDVPGLMENIISVTKWIAERAEDPRETMAVLLAKDGKGWVTTKDGNFRMYEFVEGTLCMQRAETADDFEESGKGFGRFLERLSDFPIETLHETLPNFHDTSSRYRALRDSLENDVCDRAKYVRRETDFAFEREEEAGLLHRMRVYGELPTRVTHNDTKLNNILFDKATRKALCVIDLDTVMPGLSLYDFGDAIRFGASTADGDETDLSLVNSDLRLFEAFTRGFLSACPGLTAKEKAHLVQGAKTMTLECGVRFLTDFLEGDRYFSVSRENHNLDRARTQFKLVEDMEKKWDEMLSIVEKYS
ncbi:MAG: aminoglycoside phosphotransferase family protein [Oscillospiraceae bacterium]|nr:aminoglycoside phosphotransferase family protein [Oscillospiraceae bacterium]